MDPRYPYYVADDSQKEPARQSARHPTSTEYPAQHLSTSAEGQAYPYPPASSSQYSGGQMYQQPQQQQGAYALYNVAQPQGQRGYPPSMSSHLQNQVYGGGRPGTPSSGHRAAPTAQWDVDGAGNAVRYDNYTSSSSRHAARAPSLSHTTGLIPTPAQTYGTYASGSSSATPVVVAAIPAATSAVVPPERFACEHCDRTFSRAHDKKRHIQSTHMHAGHVCRFCHKEFSRADSLKRHIDNGCEKDPEFRA